MVYREDHFGKAIFKIEAMQYKLWNKLRQANEVSLVSYKCPYNLMFNRFCKLQIMEPHGDMPRLSVGPLLEGHHKKEGEGV